MPTAPSKSEVSACPLASPDWDCVICQVQRQMAARSPILRDPKFMEMMNNSPGWAIFDTGKGVVNDVHYRSIMLIVKVKHENSLSKEDQEALEIVMKGVLPIVLKAVQVGNSKGGGLVGCIGPESSHQHFHILVH